MKGKNGPTTFLPLNINIGEQARYIKDEYVICLTEDQARHSCKKVETGNVRNVDTIKQEIDQNVDRMEIQVAK